MSRTTVSVRDLGQALYGSAEELAKFVEMQNIVANDPILKYDPEVIQVSRTELIEVWCRKLVRYHQLFPFSQKMKEMERAFFPEVMPLSVHFSMFLHTLDNLCTDEQKKIFYEPAVRGQILGCYAQTELGHGSDVQSVETTATYDAKTQTFIINTPHVSATKWWIGDLGILATHACLNAKLIINDKPYGPAMFMVQIRDMKTHVPLPGIDVGDIGPKLATNAKDNGYLRFNGVRIPRLNMLMKYSTVSKEGEFSRHGNERISYATMLSVRARIPSFCYLALAKATTIATRYSLVRRQFKDDNGREVAIMDYQLQQDKIIPAISQAYAAAFVFHHLSLLAKAIVRDAKDNNDFSRLNSTHALTSCIKAVMSADTIKSLEMLRRSAGGHGFSAYSGLPQAYLEFTPVPTYEGQNTVMLLQTARFLTKQSKSLFGQTAMQPVHKKQELLELERIRQIFVKNAAYRLKVVEDKLAEAVKRGVSHQDAWNYHAGILLTEASAAYAYYQIIDIFIKRVGKSPLLKQLLCMYAFQRMVDHEASMFESGALTKEAVGFVHELRQQTLGLLRTNIVELVDAYHLHDNSLASAIGRKEGKPYETLMEWARERNRVNRPEVRELLLGEYEKVRASLRLKRGSL